MLHSEHPGGLWVQHAESSLAWEQRKTGATTRRSEDPAPEGRGQEETGVSLKVLRALAAQTPRFPVENPTRSNPADPDATCGLPSTRQHWDHAVEHPSSMPRNLVVSLRLDSRFESFPNGSGFVRASMIPYGEC